MADLYDNNTRNRDEEEPVDMDNDLEERLYSAKNMIDLAILALYSCQELLPTALEEAYYKLQKLVDDYCVIGEV
uniref:Uncharacterized protein n=1 Tax=viral metagenome TaxID=1070528 RepID=A0A6M3L3W5_9ZZZZ